jgi:hypothetical protein
MMLNGEDVADTIERGDNGLVADIAESGYSEGFRRITS